MGLRRKIIYLVRLDDADNSGNRHAVAHVAVVKGDFVNNMLNTLGIGKRCTPCYAVNFIALFKKKLGKVRSVLTCNAGN